MALPSSGAITMAMVAAEIGISASGLSLNDSRVRQLAGKPSGAISFADLRGKSWLLPPTIGVSYSGGRFLTVGGVSAYGSPQGGASETGYMDMVLGGGESTTSIVSLTQTGGSNVPAPVITRQSNTRYAIRSNVRNKANPPYLSAVWALRIRATNAVGSADIVINVFSRDYT